MELIAASADRARPGPDRRGHARTSRGWPASSSRPPSATRPPPAGCSAPPSDVERVLVLSVVADRGLCGGYNTSVFRATERLLAAHAADGVESRLVTVGKKAQGYFRFRGQDVEQSFLGHERAPELRRRPCGGRRRRHPVRGRRGGPGRGRLDPVRQRRHPAGRGAPAPAPGRPPQRRAERRPRARAGQPQHRPPRATSARATPSSSPTPPCCSSTSPPGPPRPRSSPPCSRPRPRSSPPGSGPWPPPPRTPASSSRSTRGS